MSRKFITQREVDFVNAIAHELIQNVVGQEIKYYGISIPETQVNDLYSEAIQKTWNPPVSVNALVQWDNQNTVSSNMGQDAQYSLEVYFHALELTERNVLPREGDFVEFGQVFFEITSVTQPQLVFGQVNNKVMTKCVCVPSREGQFQMGNSSSDDVDNSHPIAPNPHVNR